MQVIRFLKFFSSLAAMKNKAEHAVQSYVAGVRALGPKGIIFTICSSYDRATLPTLE